MYKKKYFGLFIFLSFYIFPLFADVPRYIQLTQSVEGPAVQNFLKDHRLDVEETLLASDVIPFVEKADRKKFSDDVLQKLYDYRKNIQENAYSTTMKLCPAYRIAKGIGLPEYHEKSNDSYYVQHRSPEVRHWALNMNDEYGESLSSSLQAWLYVMYEGGVQPFSAMGGIKADFIDKLNLSFFEAKSWFYSFYTLYLIDSLGFLQAAMHCLDTMDVDEIHQFASTILAVDVTMSMAGYVLTFWTGEKIFGAIIRGIQWSSRPIGRMMTRAMHRRGISPKMVKKYAIVAGGVALGVLGLWAIDSIMESQEEQERIQEIIKEEIERAKNKPPDS